MRLLASALAVFLLAPAALAQRVDVPGEESVASSRLLTDDVRLAVSAEAHGLSGAGLFDRGGDPLRMLQNPALLADTGGLTLAGSLTPDYLALDAFGLEGGAVAYPLALPTAARPLAVVLGASTTRVDYADDTDREGFADRVSTIALGVGWRGTVPVRAGLGVRALTTAGTEPAFGPTDLPAQRAFRSSAVALDVGADVTLPVSEWVRPAPASGPRVGFDLTGGAAFRGLTMSRTSRATLDGVAVEGGFPVQAETNLSLGTSARLGLDVGPAARPVRAVEVAALADAVTYEFDETGVLLGARATLFEALTVRVGSARLGSGYTAPTSVGVGVSGGGLLRALGACTGDRRLVALGTRFDLRYDVATQPSDFSVTTTGPPMRGDWQTHTLRLRIR